MQVLSATLVFAALATSCTSSEEPEVIPPYDASTRVPTDENEQVVTLNADDY